MLWWASDSACQCERRRDLYQLKKGEENDHAYERGFLMQRREDKTKGRRYEGFVSADIRGVDDQSVNCSNSEQCSKCGELANRGQHSMLNQEQEYSLLTT